jgi:RNA-directed DNA polymerase
VKRWLAAPLQLPDGTVVERDRGTPQGSAVSPCWRTCSCTTRSTCGWPGSTRRSSSNADDAVVHCVTERRAREVLAALVNRMEEVGLRLHPAKIKIV